jgi:hypothetical protein
MAITERVSRKGGNMSDQNGQKKKSWFHAGNIIPAIIFSIIIAATLLMRMCNS